MKRNWTLFLLTTAFIFAGCARTEADDQIENDPLLANTGQQTITASYDPYPFTEAVAEADLIVEVKICTAIGEVHEPTPKTILEADVLQVFKGESDETLTFFQNGTEAIRVNEQPLLQAGDVYTVFLKETVNSVEAEYFILAEETGIYRIEGEQVIKLALPDEELDDVMLETTVHEPSGQHQQHLDKASFYTLLTEKVSEQEEDN